MTDGRVSKVITRERLSGHWAGVYIRLGTMAVMKGLFLPGILFQSWQRLWDGSLSFVFCLEYWSARSRSSSPHVWIQYTVSLRVSTHEVNQQLEGDWLAETRHIALIFREPSSRYSCLVTQKLEP